MLLSTNEIFMHNGKGVGRKIFRGGGNGKNKFMHNGQFYKHKGKGVGRMHNEYYA